MCAAKVAPPPRRLCRWASGVTRCHPSDVNLAVAVPGKPQEDGFAAKVCKTWRKRATSFRAPWPSGMNSHP